MKRTWQSVLAVVVALALLALAWSALRPSSTGATPSPGPGASRTSASTTRATTTTPRATSGRATTSAPQGTTRAPGAQATDPATGLRWVSLEALPAEAAATLASIKAGPPYAYPRNDGVVYHNNNRVLPSKPDGYYHEFTVKTPGASGRGARRIITGGADRGQANAEYYYTADHYDSFERIRP